jgi:predicted ATPase/DNA-binding SARP family transcriptional activator
VPIAGRRDRALLAALATQRGEVVSTARLIDAIWGEHPPASAVKLVHNGVLRLRKAIGTDPIATRPGGYVLAVPRQAFDICRLEHLVQVGRDHVSGGRWSRAVECFDAARRLHRGRAFEDLGDWPPAEVAARVLDEQCRCAEDELVQAIVASGRHHEWAADLELLACEEPLREVRSSCLALAMYRSHRQTDALRALRRARAALAEVGLEPSPELVALERNILARDPSLDVTPATPAGVRRTHEHPRSNLPTPLTGFVGRHAEVTEVLRLLADHRLVTLIGVGGVGKTRLALEVAGSVDEDGVWLVELAPVSDPSAVLAPAMRALGLVASADDEGALEAAVCERLAERRALLVFDNCEHLIAAAAPAIHRILTACPDVRILATSREPLALAGEVSFLVPPMSLPCTGADDGRDSDAVELFCQRASAANPSFALTADNRTCVVDVCRRLDGIPLAIELAAARTRVLSPSELLERLDEGLRVLEGGTRADLPRHRTMQAALDWSYDLLTPRERTVLLSLAVFPERFDLDAALAMAKDDDLPRERDGFEVLARLVDKSLVVAETMWPRTRYRLLQPIRRFALGKLDAAGETDETLRRHRDIYLERTLRWSNDHAVVANGPEILADIANYRQAFEWSWVHDEHHAAARLLVAQAPIWFWTGYPGALTALEGVVARVELDDAERAWVMARLALVLHDSGRADPTRERELVEGALALARTSGSTEVLLTVTWTSGELHLAWGDPHTARAELSAALHQEERRGFTNAMAWCRISLGWTAIALGDFAEAARLFEQAAGAVDGPAGAWVDLHASAGLAPLTALRGDPEEARRLARRAVEGARVVPVHAMLTLSLVGAAETATILGDDGWARETIAELLDLLRDQVGLRWVADALDLAGTIVASDLPEVARCSFTTAATLRASTGGSPEGLLISADVVNRARHAVSWSAVTEGVVLPTAGEVRRILDRLAGHVRR